MPLFKYVCPERVGVIQNLKIRFTPASEFNDPFEFMPDTSVLFDPVWEKQTEENLVAKVLKIGKPAPGATPEQIAEAVRMTVRSIRQDLKPEAQTEFVDGLREVKGGLRILCLSRLKPDTPEALLMWAHYTCGHQGFVIAFHEDHPWITGNVGCGIPYRDFGEVDYLPKRPRSKMGASEREYYLVKSEHWKYEREVRLVRAEGDPDLDAASLSEFPAEALASITLGVSALDTTRTSILDGLRSNPNLSSVKLYQARVDPDEYRLRVEPMPLQ